MPYPGIMVPDGTCPTCQLGFKGSKPEDLVITRCRALHPFHRECLDYWVNGAAMDDSNTCPNDRDRLCEPRDRIHASERYGHN